MASPNDKNFQDALTRHRDGEVRSPYDIIKKWARHPEFRKYHLRDQIPYLLFGPDVLLIEYSFMRSGVRYYYRIWEDLRANTASSTHFRCDYGSGSGSCSIPGCGALAHKLSKIFDECDSLYPRSHYAKINHTRSFSTSRKWWDFKVDDELKMRSEIAREVFEIVAKVDDQGLIQCDKTAKSELDEMVRLSEGE